MATSLRTAGPFRVLARRPPPASLRGGRKSSDACGSALLLFFFIFIRHRRRRPRGRWFPKEGRPGARRRLLLRRMHSNHRDPGAREDVYTEFGGLPQHGSCSCRLSVQLRSLLLRESVNGNMRRRNPNAGTSDVKIGEIWTTQPERLTAVVHRRAEIRGAECECSCLRTAALFSTALHRLCPLAVRGASGKRRPATH